MMDDDAIARMCLALNEEDPGDAPVRREQVLQTLNVLRKEPARGKAVVAEIDGQVVGYALLISFWSNELGGEVCVVDELYVAPTHRRRGIGTKLLHTLRDGDGLWPERAAAIGLEVTPTNVRARQLFSGLGFTGSNTAMHLARRPTKRGETR
ncbi:MAG: GNAT family N-acetyltransferase [Deltaproteobacteria bacterium]|nr:GNAT family N-acetyltransferase [Deltaproteobacteria bacterium]